MDVRHAAIVWLAGTDDGGAASRLYNYAGCCISPQCWYFTLTPAATGGHDLLGLSYTSTKLADRFIEHALSDRAVACLVEGTVVRNLT